MVLQPKKSHIKGSKDFINLYKEVQNKLKSENSKEFKIKEIKRLLAEKALEYNMECYLFEAIEEIYTDRYYALEAEKRRKRNGK